MNFLADTTWQLAHTAPGAAAAPVDLADALGWHPATVPGTVAGALLAEPVTGLYSGMDFDAFDWWYRGTFRLVRPPAGTPCLLVFEGLATLAEVWLNDTRILTTDNMFRRYELEVDALLGAENTLHLAFRALTPALATKRPRPRWKTRLVHEQNLRWVRTSLLGRIPAWTPPVKPVGPWRGVHLRVAEPVLASECRVRAMAEGAAAALAVEAQLRVADGLTIERAWLCIGGGEHLLELERDPGGVRVSGRIDAGALARWWPHTHGEPVLHAWTLTASTDRGDLVVAEGRTGIRELRVERGDGRVAFELNGTEVFCRGACWTAADIRTLDGEPDRLRALLERARDAGINMIRVGGTMAYASESFCALCDELGILLWQDFMFANMDYPFDDEAFATNLLAEAREQLRRIGQHACVAAWCGNSEIEQQAAMLGLGREHWRHAFFADTLPALCAAEAPGAAYFPSTPCEGALPFHVGEGLAHYYGVGAYQRDFADLALADVKFTPECVGLSHVPIDETVLAFMGTTLPQTHHPAWKAGVPRDAGSGWDFEDIRDFYLQRLFGVDAVSLRYADIERYLALSRVTSGEVLARVFAWWRSAGRCGGGLVWTLNDIVPGAGWGLFDSAGRAKPALYLLGQVLQPRQVLLLDRGLDGHAVCLLNETPVAAGGRLIVDVWSSEGLRLAGAERAIALAPRERQSFAVDELLGHFRDTTYAYRFGPPQHAALSARWVAADGTLLSQALAPALGREPAPLRECGVSARIEERVGEHWLVIASDRLLQYAAIELRGYEARQNWLHIVPGQEYCIGLRRDADGVRFRGQLTALNASGSFRIAGPADG